MRKAVIEPINKPDFPTPLYRLALKKIKRNVIRIRQSFAQRKAYMLYYSAPERKHIELYRNELIRFANSYPVNKIKLGSDLVWPTIRFALWRALRATWEGKKNVTVNPLRMQLSKQWMSEFKNKYGALEIHEIEKKQSLDFLFFVNQRGVEQTTLNGKIYNRITDPVFEQASKIGKAMKVEILKSSGFVNTTRHHKPLFIIPPLKRTVGYVNELSSPVSLCNDIRYHIPSINFENKDLNNCIEWHYHSRDIYKSILEKLRPKVVFFIGFEFHLPLCAAAHQLRIKTVDLQHGNQTGWGPLYKWWDEMPPTGYNCLPDYFWVWGKRDYQHIKENIRGKKHRPIIGGYPWIERQKDFGNPLSINLQRKLKDYQKVILVSLQHQEHFPQILQKIISQSPEDYLWLLRKHPKGLPIRKKGPLNRKNVLISQEIDNALLSYLLPEIDVHLTAGSTVVLEADYFGVPSIVWDSTGVENYAELIEEGKVFSLEHAEEFPQIMEQLENWDREPKISCISQINTKEVLTKLLGKPKKKKKK